jgi:hypothetical protein
MPSNDCQVVGENKYAFSIARIGSKTSIYLLTPGKEAAVMCPARHSLIGMNDTLIPADNNRAKQTKYFHLPFSFFVIHLQRN